jgi:endonuclease YncB( thermonuclease family)
MVGWLRWRRTRARDYVVREIGKKPFVVVTTTRKDKYARYLADVFYGKDEDTEEEVLKGGTFLNRALVAGRYAGRYRG